VIENIVETVRKIIPGAGGEAAPVIPVVRLAGAIGKVSRLQSGLSLATTAGPLKKAFAIKSAPAVALIIDSPGGSPVQSHLIFKRIRALAEEKEKPVLVFVEDVCASGGYMIACAGDEIIVDEASIVGSIGVVSAGFGFPEAIKKLGVERRVYTSGESKVILDPFQPEKEADVERLKAIQEDIHELFIDLVKGRRGDVLGDDPEIFSGLFWSGKSALSLGLADRIGDLRSVIEEKFGKKARIKMIGGGRSPFPRRLFGLGALGEALTGAIAGELEERALRARYGL
jgi:signal peptide peptidase SppA